MRGGVIQVVIILTLFLTMSLTVSALSISCPTQNPKVGVPFSMTVSRTSASRVGVDFEGSVTEAAGPSAAITLQIDSPGTGYIVYAVYKTDGDWQYTDGGGYVTCTIDVDAQTPNSPSTFNGFVIQPTTINPNENVDITFAAQDSDGLNYIELHGSGISGGVITRTCGGGTQCGPFSQRVSTLSTPNQYNYYITAVDSRGETKTSNAITVTVVDPCEVNPCVDRNENDCIGYYCNAGTDYVCEPYNINSPGIDCSDPAPGVCVNGVCTPECTKQPNYVCSTSGRPNPPYVPSSFYCSIYTLSRYCYGCAQGYIAQSGSTCTYCNQCTVDDTTCQSDVTKLYTCQTNATGCNRWVGASCGTNKICVNSACVDTCTPDTYRCSGLSAQRCIAQGAYGVWSTEWSSCNDQNVCTADSCTAGPGCTHTPTSGSCTTPTGQPGTCQNGQCVQTGCTPKCAGKACGASDECGATCPGTCTAPSAPVCILTGLGYQCVQCTPETVLANCGAGHTCVNNMCQDVCTPDCAGKVCGPDGCGGMCGSCPTGQQCIEATGQCGVNTCTVDADCDDGNVCTSNLCLNTPEGKRCHYDGISGPSCALTGGGAGTCVAGVCTCTPQCSGKACGDDGCGGSCGVCASGSCVAGACTVTPCVVTASDVDKFAGSVVSVNPVFGGCPADAVAVCDGWWLDPSCSGVAAYDDVGTYDVEVRVESTLQPRVLASTMVDVRIRCDPNDDAHGACCDAASGDYLEERTVCTRPGAGYAGTGWCTASHECSRHCNESSRRQCASDQASIIEVVTDEWCVDHENIIQDCAAGERCIPVDGTPTCSAVIPECTHDYTYDCLGREARRTDQGCGDVTILDTCTQNEACEADQNSAWCRQRAPCEDEPGTISCDDACIDPQADDDNCGGCGRSCASTQKCVRGTCTEIDGCHRVCSVNADCAEGEVCVNRGDCFRNRCEALNVLAPNATLAEQLAEELYATGLVHVAYAVQGRDLVFTVTNLAPATLQNVSFTATIGKVIAEQASELELRDPSIAMAVVQADPALRFTLPELETTRRFTLATGKEQDASYVNYITISDLTYAGDPDLVASWNATQGALTIGLNSEFDGNKTTFRFSLNPSKDLAGLSVPIEIPKCLAEKIKNVTEPGTFTSGMGCRSRFGSRIFEIEP